MRIANDARSPLDNPAGGTPTDRTIGALISEFSSLGPLFADSDLIGTFPRIMMAWDMQTYGLRPVVPQITPATFRTRFFWSSRLANDPASKWIREIVLTTYAELDAEADRGGSENLNSRDEWFFRATAA